MPFSHLGLSDKVIAAVAAAGYTTPTPIQEQAIPHVLARRAVLGIAQTGTGKPAAFVLPPPPHSGTADPPCPGPPRGSRHRPDRHRQDRCLRPANAHFAGKGPRPGA